MIPLLGAIFARITGHVAEHAVNNAVSHTADAATHTVAGMSSTAQSGAQQIGAGLSTSVGGLQNAAIDTVALAGGVIGISTAFGAIDGKRSV